MEGVGEQVSGGMFQQEESLAGAALQMRIVSPLKQAETEGNSLNYAGKQYAK